MVLHSPETPILSALLTHAKREKMSFHMPGHHQGRTLPDPISAWVGQMPKWDVTELDNLDNYHQPEGCIRASEDLTARYYGADRTIYSVNGATACVMGAICAAVEAMGRQQILLFGPCHVSVSRALVHAGADPVFIPGQWNATTQELDYPSIEDLRTALASHSDIAAIVVTSPTYQGQVGPVEAIVHTAHGMGIPVIVDEAHGAHFGLHPNLPMHSVAKGADIVIQSPHKTLPCFTQAAWVHGQGGRVASNILERWVRGFNTTSPSYLLLAALDGVQAWLRGPGPAAAERTLDMLSELATRYDGLQSRFVGGISPGVAHGRDSMRLWIPSQTASGLRLATMLREKGIYLEYQDRTGLLFLFGFLQPENEFERLFETLNEWQRTEQQQSAEAEQDVSGLVISDFEGETSAVFQLYEKLSTRSLAISMREVMFAPKRFLPLRSAVDCVIATPLTPYPPGVPVIWPGHVLSAQDVAMIENWLQQGGQMTGIDESHCVEVVRNAE